MKKNTNTYVLLAAVALIWGTIGYRIISGMNDEPTPPQGATAVKFKPLPTKEKETFTILAEYRDPFLGTLPKKPAKKVTRSSKPKAAPMPVIQITYTGFVADKDTKQNIFFVSINGTQHLMSPAKEIDKVKLLSGNAKSIRVQYHNKIKTIPLKE